MKKETKIKIFKLFLIILALFLIFLAIYLPLKFSGTLDKIDSIEELKNIILEAGIYSYIIFFLIQFLQVVLLPIPGLITTIAGALVFGPWIASTISITAITIASIFSFYIGRKFGKKLVIWILGKEDTKKWSKKLERGKYVFFLMMLFPLFPDDILCIMVGATTTISYKFFIITNLITRPIGVLGATFIGSGILIPFSSWGIPVWIVIIISGIILFYLSIKYQSEIESSINKFASNLSRRQKLGFHKKSTSAALETSNENNDIKPQNQNYTNKKPNK